MSARAEPPFILVVDDDARCLARMRNALRLAGAQVAACRTAAVALEALEFHMPGVVVVAAEMEDGRGWDVVYAARKQGPLPTVVLDRGVAGATRKTAFAAGVDDVLASDSPDDELATRILARAARDHPHGANAPVYRHRGLAMDVAAHTVRVDGRLVSLTAQQFAILRALFEANGATLARESLLARIESLDDEPPSYRAVDLHVTRLRRRLGDDPHAPRWVEAVYGVGYRLTTESAAPVEFSGEAAHVLAALPNPLFVIDRERHVRFANDAASRFLGLPHEDVVGRRCADVLRCEDRCGERINHARCFARAVSAGEATLRDVPASITIGDEVVPVRFTYAPVPGVDLMTLEIRPDDPSAG